MYLRNKKISRVFFCTNFNRTQRLLERMQHIEPSILLDRSRNISRVSGCLVCVIEPFVMGATDFIQ